MDSADTVVDPNTKSTLSKDDVDDHDVDADEDVDDADIAVNEDGQSIPFFTLDFDEPVTDFACLLCHQTMIRMSQRRLPGNELQRELKPSWPRRDGRPQHLMRKSELKGMRLWMLKAMWMSSVCACVSPMRARKARVANSHDIRP